MKNISCKAVANIVESRLPHEINYVALKITIDEILFLLPYSKGLENIGYASSAYRWLEWAASTYVKMHIGTTKS